MIDLYLALYAEGTTDDRFLKSVIERVAGQIVRANKGELVEVHPVFVVDRGLLNASDGAGKILQAAVNACEYDVFIVHKDADTQTHQEVKDTRFEPGYILVRQCLETEKVCRTLVPLVSDKTIEAWMLAEMQAILTALDAKMNERELRAELKKINVPLKSKPQQVKSLIKPKQTLDQIVRIACTQRGMTREDLYEPLGDNIDLQILERLDSYKQFVDDLTAAITALGKIQLRGKKMTRTLPVSGASKN